MHYISDVECHVHMMTSCIVVALYYAQQWFSNQHVPANSLGNLEAKSY
jgi:hypothetical protein